MPQDNYSIFTDVSGALLQNLDSVVYQNYDPSYIPVYGSRYKLTNYNQTIIANTFIPYASSPLINDQYDYMKFNASNTLYITSRNYLKSSIQYYIEPVNNIGIGRFADIGYNFGDYNQPYPYGIAFDPTGILYVTMNNNREWFRVTESWILKINLTTLVGTRLIVPGTTFGHLYGCAFDNSGNFYVADYTNNQITKITMVDYFTGTATIYANLYNGITNPNDITFDRLGNAYISNFGSNNIIKISTDNTSSIFGANLLNPYSVAYDNFTNILYVANYGDWTSNGPIVPGYLVSIVNGTTTRVPSSSGIPQNPSSVAITSTGTLYVTANIYTGNILDVTYIIYKMVPYNVINSYLTQPYPNKLYYYAVALNRTDTYLYGGQYKLSYRENSSGIWKFLNRDVSGNSPILFYRNPALLNGTAYSMDFDLSGNLYVVNGTSSEYVYYLDFTSNIIFITPSGVGSQVDWNSGNDSITSIKFDGTGIMYAASYGDGTIYKITFSSPGYGNNAVLLTGGESITTPTSLAFNSTYTKLYVSCYSPAKIVEINLATHTARRYDVSGVPLRFPIYIAYDSSASVLYVSSEGKIGGSSYSYMYEISSSGVVSEVNANFYFNTGITLNNSNTILYAGNSLERSPGGDIGISDYVISTGELYTNYIGYSPSNVTSVIFDKTYTYLYASTYNNEIWKIPNIDISGNVGILFYNNDNTGPSLDRPTTLEFDLSGNLYVGNTSNTIIVITPAGVGALVVITGVALNTPSSIKFDASFYYMYVSNYSTNTICRLHFSTPTTATSTIFNTTGESIITPVSLSFNTSYTTLYVSCQTANKIVQITIATAAATIYNKSGLNLSLPTGIVYDQFTDVLYISNQGTNQIYIGTNDNYISKFSTIDSSSNYLSGALKIVVDISSNLYLANYGNDACPIACVNPNNNWLIKYDNRLLITDGIVAPDRDTKTSYIYNSLLPLTTTKIYALNYSNFLSPTPPVVSPGYTSMALGTNRFNQKYLALAYAYGTLSIAFIPFTPSNTLPAGNFASQNTGISINSGETHMVFADISNIIKSLFVATTDFASTPGTPSNFVRVDVAFVRATGLANITSTAITINFPGGIMPNIRYMGVYPVFQSGKYTKYLYMGMAQGPNIYRVDISVPGNTYTATLYITTLTPSLGTQYGCTGLSLDDNGYLYAVSAGVIYPSYYLYRALPNAPTTSSFIVLNQYMTDIIPYSLSLTYSKWDQSLILYSPASDQIFKYYIGFPFTNMNSINTIGPYDDTGYIFDITSGANTYKFNFNIYTPYVVIDPSNIPINTPSEVSIHFVIPFVQPAPADSYKLLCDGQYISDVFCNNCTYNKTKFLSGTYPTGLVSSFFSNYLYVALQNNTISRIDTFGIVENNYIPTSAGLNGPTSLVLDASFNMFVLNAGSTYITKIILEDNILDVDNNYFTGINTPICLTYDSYSNDYLYLLSGQVPTMRLTKILASDPTQNEIIGLPFGTLYNSNGLTIDEFNPGSKFLYVSNTDQFGNYSIIQIPLPYTGVTLPSRLGSYLSFQPYTMANKNDGYLYVANKTSNSISKISVDSVLITPNSEQPWVSTGISVPAGLCFDASGNLYVANSGTGPRNSRISKIYIDYFFFTKVVIDSTPCEAQIYDLTTQSFVDVGYYSPPADQTIFPIPIPFPINS